MSSVRQFPTRFDRPIRQNDNLAGNGEALLAHGSQSNIRNDGGIEQDVTIATFLGEIKTDATVRQSLVGAKFANRILEGVSKIFERLSDNCTHYNFPALFVGAKCARGKVCNASVEVANRFVTHPSNYRDRLVSLFGTFATSARI